MGQGKVKNRSKIKRLNFGRKSGLRTVKAEYTLKYKRQLEPSYTVYGLWFTGYFYTGF